MTPRRTRRTRGPQTFARKVAISLRVHPDTLDRYKATGDGWQTRMSRDLDEAIRRRETSTVNTD